MVRIAQRGTLLKMSVPALEDRLNRLESELDSLHYSKKHKTKSHVEGKIKEKRVSLVKSEIDKTEEILQRVNNGQRKR